MGTAINEMCDHVLTQEPLRWMDATPDNEYPLRILKAHLENCKCKWSTESDGTCNDPVLKSMNEANDKRAKILTKAISLIERRMHEDTLD